MVVLGLSVIIAVIIHRTLFVSQLEYITSRNTIDELRAKYSARSGVELNLLRLRVFKEIQLAMEGEKEQQAIFRPYVDFIWRWPVIWPLPIQEEITESDRQSLNKIETESFLKGSYFTEILPEDGKMNLNALAGSLDYLANFTIDSLTNLLIIEAGERGLELESEEAVRVLLNLADWMDKDNDSRNGGSEESIEPGNMPLNRSFVFVEEMRSVPGMTEEIFRILKPHVSVYGDEGVNVNYTTKPLLKAIGVSEEVAEAVLLRIQPSSSNYKLFVKIDEFCNFLSEQGGDLCPGLEQRYDTLEMLKINTPLHFLIRGQGGSHRASSQVEALVYDANSGLKSYKKAVEVHNELVLGTDDSSEGLPASDSPTREDSQASTQPKSRKSEKMKYQSFSPIFIMYWRED